MSFATVLYEVRGHVAWITLNRPEQLNAVDTQMMADLHAAFDAAEADPAARLAVLTGAGRAFCAGADLKHMRGLLLSGEAEAIRRYISTMRDLLIRVEAFEKPAIAAINGIAMAAGLGLTLCCDLAIAAEDARIGDGHANYAVLPGGGTTARLPRKIGPTRAKELLYGGGVLDARTCLAWGLVNEVAPASEFRAAVERMAANLAGKSPLVLRRLKKLVDDGLESAKHAAYRNETLAWEAHALSHDLREGLTAFGEKRPPDYRGS
jgi:enoyl-CoA hydratase/carnithine racemase